MYPYIGDFPTGATIFFPFATYSSAGASVTLTGLATTDIEVYKGASMTQRSSDAGFALVDTDGIDLDGITGIHGFTIDTSDNTDSGFYAAGSDYTVVISAVTVDSQTVNFIAGRFSIDNRGLLRPTTATRTLDVTATGAAGIDWGNVENPTTAVNLSATNIDVDQVVASVSGAVGSVTGAVGSVTGAVGSVTGAVGSVTGAVGSIATGGISEASFATTAGSFAPLGIVDQGTAQSATGTTIVLRSAAAFANDELIGATVYIVSATAGAGQSRVITDYVLSTDTATVDTWTTTPSGTIVYKIFATPPASATSVPAVNVTQWLGSACATPSVSGVPEVDLTHVAGATTNVAALATNVDAILTDTGTTLDGKLNTIDDFLDTEIAAILADTNELQTDWANGGRLDLILDSAASAGDPWGTALPGAYGAGTAGQIIGDNLNATVSSRASQTSVDTVDDLLDTELAAVKTVVDSILVDTAEIGAAGAGLTVLATAAALDTVDNFLDTEIAAIKAKTDSLTFTVANVLDANIQRVNDVAITGDGSGTPFNVV